MSEINPQDFGRMTAQVQSLEKTVEKMAVQIDSLMTLVNQGRGAFWLAVILGGAISSVATFIASKLPIFQGAIK